MNEWKSQIITVIPFKTQDTFWKKNKPLKKLKEEDPTRFEKQESFSEEGSTYYGP